ncbi:MAG: Hsp33 family molecular chaperone HslO [Candidatus Tyrphobacter sp.]
MPDSVVSSSAVSGGIALCGASVTELVREIRDHHDLSPLATAAVGRLVAAAVLFAAGLKARERVSIQIAAEGPIGALFADAWLLDDATIGARGYARNPHVELPLSATGKFDVGGALGAGQLQVTKTYAIGQPYRGIVPLVTGEIAEDIAAYLARSEQIPSAVALGVLANPSGVIAAGGTLAQVLPGADDRAIEELDRRARAMPPVTDVLRDGADADVLVGALAGDLKLREHRRLSVRFACLCSRERVEAALVGLGADDLRHMAAERDTTHASCEFCKRDYAFTSAELLALSQSLSSRV